jgi:sigma-E factor negative regulatory protein RseA
MNEELDSQLSAMFDDELPEAECELLARRLSRDDALKARWRRYAVMGAAIRSERGVRLEANLAARVGATISTEPALSGGTVAGARGARSRLRWWQPLAGTAIAAGVAAMSVLWVRAHAPPGSETLMAQTAAPVASRSNGPSAAPESYVVPAAAEQRSIVPAAQLANYVVAHSEFSAPLSRRNLLSTLVASESGTGAAPAESEDAVEGSNDEAPVGNAANGNAPKAQ